MSNFKILLEASVEFCEHSHRALVTLLAFHGVSLDEFLMDAVQAQIDHLKKLRQENVKAFGDAIACLDADDKIGA